MKIFENGQKSFRKTPLKKAKISNVFHKLNFSLFNVR